VKGNTFAGFFCGWRLLRWLSTRVEYCPCLGCAGSLVASSPFPTALVSVSAIRYHRSRDLQLTARAASQQTRRGLTFGAPRQPTRVTWTSVRLDRSTHGEPACALPDCPYFVASTVDDLLRLLFEALRTRGTRTSPSRGEATELTGILVELTNPRARLSRTESRGRPFSCLGELCWYLTGSDELAFIQHYIPEYPSTGGWRHSLRRLRTAFHFVEGLRSVRSCRVDADRASRITSGCSAALRR